MQISKDDLDFLVELEDFIYRVGVKRINLTNMTDDEVECLMGMYFHKLYDITESLLQQTEREGKE